MNETNKPVNTTEHDVMRHEYEITELEHKVYDLEYRAGVLWRWCLVNSILLVVFTLLLALR